MSQEFAYAILTPYTLSKSRTGGVIARLITRTGLDLCGARMFSPSQELAEAYAEMIVSAEDPQDRRIQEQLRDYIRQNFSPDPKTGQRRRVMVLLFRGEDAVRKVRSVVGHITGSRRTGETIRDTFGDYITDEAGNLRHLEPAVFAAPNTIEARQKLELWTRYSDSDGGWMDNTIAYAAGETPQRTLVLIKPDNFRFPTGRPGNVIDFFSRTGLYIVAVKVHRMSTGQAIEFYGPVLDTLRNRLKDMVGARAQTALEKEFGFPLPDDAVRQLGEVLGPLYGENRFAELVRFMAGRAPAECPPDLLNAPGSEKCLAIVYEGVDAVRKIRDVLGPTDPAKAPPGSIRREFGSTLMINAAHASDSPENAAREIGIVKATENNFRTAVEEVYGKV